jgi:hypothetical protein
MPTNRKRVDRRRSDALNLNQESVLCCGSDLFPGLPGFEDEEHAREAWGANRDRLMAENAHPGERPWAYWAYDWSLEEMRDANGDVSFAWPAPIQSEQEMVYDLLKRGKLKSCKLNGGRPIDSELRVIRENWLREIGWEVGWADRVPKRATPLPTYGCPVWFYREHAPRILAEAQAERAKRRVGLGREVEDARGG